MLKRIFILFISIVASASYNTICGQVQNTTDSLIVKPNTDSVTIDGVKKKEAKKSKLDSKIDYKAQDSMHFDIENKKVFLYGKAEVTYGEINLKAAYIVIDFDKNIVNAKFVLDSNNKEIGVPEFTEGSENFKAKELAYNFETKKGFIKKLFTEEGDGFMHGNLVRKEPDNSVLIKNGAYTTCSLEHPHFAIKFDKAKVIPNDKIVTGPAYLSIEDVPTPLMIPFGFFPNVKGQKNGILIPTYGQSANRGLFLEKGGYYFGFSERMDLQVRGTIYSRGSWGVYTLSNYNKRYKYNGNFSVNYSNNKLGEKGMVDYSVNKDFIIRWTHNQDLKARPRSRFSANVNAGTSKYNRFNSTNATNYLQNDMQSSISYSTSFGKVFNFSTNVRHSQSNTTKLVYLTLPEVALSTSRMYPFKRKVAVGEKRWYENIGLTYTMNSKNEVTTADSTFILPYIKDNLKNGIKHSVPISTNFKLSKYATLTPSINFNERWYFDYTQKSCLITTDTLGKKHASVVDEKMRGFQAAHDIDFNLNLTSKLYGLVQFKKGPIKAFRHVVTPNAGFSFHPDWFINDFNTRKVQIDTAGNKFEEYSIFKNGIFGAPAYSKYGLVNLSVSNNFEMKVRSRKDTISGFKKIMLIDNLSIATAYDVARKSKNWNPIAVNARTRLFKSLDISYDCLFDQYIVDSALNHYDRYEINVNNRLLRLASDNWKFNLTWNLSSQKFNKKQDQKKTITSENVQDQQQLADINKNPENYVDFNIPWNLNIIYSFGHSKIYNDYFGTKKPLTNTLNFNGDISITKKWKIGFSSGYDITNKGFSYTSIDIYRDLHCWEMKFNWIPMGFNKQFLFTINVKSSVLQDLKLTKKNDPAWK